MLIFREYINEIALSRCFEVYKGCYKNIKMGFVSFVCVFSEKLRVIYLLFCLVKIVFFLFCILLWIYKMIEFAWYLGVSRKDCRELKEIGGYEYFEVLGISIFIFIFWWGTVVCFDLLVEKFCFKNYTGFNCFY